MKKIAGIATLAGAAAVAATISLGGGTASASTYCGAVGQWDVYSGNSSTSCGFALSVAETGNLSVPHDVYSPVTGQYYRVFCEVASEEQINCRGGNGAVVYIMY